MQMVPALIQNGQKYMTYKQKANILAISDAKIQSNDAHSNIENTVNEKVTQVTQNTHEISSDDLTTLLTNPTKIKNFIKHLPYNKAPSPDKIPNFVLKNLAKKTIVQLTYIINVTLKLHFLHYWKNAIIISMYKKDKDTHDPLSCRLISLLNTLAKLAEKIIHRRLTD